MASDFRLFGMSGFIPNFDELEQYALAQESQSALLIEELKDGSNQELFYEFMDSLCECEVDFHRFAELLKNVLVHDNDYLDHCLEFREFVRNKLIHFIDETARKIIQSPPK